jgi:hypothetical protein
MILALDKYTEHNYHNEKVKLYIAENFYGDREESTGWGCACENEVDHDFTDRIDSEFLVKAIPNLTDEEKEELMDIEQLWVYYCPMCEHWGMDGQNV